MSQLVIRSDEEAFAWLESYLAGEAKNDSVILEGWPKLSIRLTGEKFDQSLTPSIMKGFVELQAAINRSYALSKYGTSNAGKLSKEERDTLEIRVKVDKGSTVLEVNFQELLTHVATKAVGAMDPLTLAGTIVGLGAIWGSSTAYKAYLNHRKEIRMQEISSESDREQLSTLKFMSAEETKRAEVMASLINSKPVFDNAARYADDARTDILKSMSKADTAQIDGVEIDSETATQLVTNARRKSEEVRLDGIYRILRNDTTDPTAFKVRVRNEENKAEFDALVQDESLNYNYKSLLQQAEWGRKPVNLRINAKSLEGSIRSAVVIGVKPAEVADDEGNVSE